MRVDVTISGNLPSVTMDGKLVVLHFDPAGGGVDVKVRVGK